MRVRCEIRLALGCLCAVLALAASPARAQEIALGRGAKGAQSQHDEAEHTRGTYAGVKPGGDAPPGTTAKPGAKPAEITWPGFQMQPDGSSRVFLQSTLPIDARFAMAGNKVLIDLGEALIVRANRYPLFTQFFNTPVTRVEIKRAHKRATLEITLRAPVEPRISTEQAKSGFHFVYIDFPAGEYLPKVPAAAREPAAPPPPPKPQGMDLDEAPSQLDDSGGSLSGASDAELPPGMAKPKAKARAGAGVQGTVKVGR